jgi:hypothetical protein
MAHRRSPEPAAETGMEMGHCDAPSGKSDSLTSGVQHVGTTNRSSRQMLHAAGNPCDL